MQQDSGPGAPSAAHLPEPPGRAGRDRPGRTDGHQRVPVPVQTRPLELLRARREDRLRERVESGYVGHVLMYYVRRKQCLGEHVSLKIGGKCLPMWLRIMQFV